MATLPPKLRTPAWIAAGTLLTIAVGAANPSTVNPFTAWAPAPTSAGAAPSSATSAPALSAHLGASQGGRKKKRTSEATKLDPFIGDLAEARVASKEQNVPLLIHLILEGESENDAYRDTILKDKALIAASELAIILIANNGEHELKKITEEVEGVMVESQVCSTYPSFANCAQHRASWDSIYVAYHDDLGDLNCPQAILALPDGKEAYRKNDGNPPTPKEVLAKLVKAQADAGQGLSRKELAEIKRLEREAARSTDAKLWGQAWRDWNAVLDIIEVGLYADLARAAQPKLEGEMRTQLAQTALGLVPGKAAAAFAELVHLKDAWKDTPVESEVAKTLSKAEKDKEIQDEIRAWKLEQEAAELLQEAVDCFEAEDTKGARKALRKLFSKKYAETKAAAKGLEAFPEFAPEEKPR